MESDAIQLTRAELYERVWSEPMQTLAPQYGLSDVGLAKLCRRMRIPTPPRGYWARKAAGQKVTRDGLPRLSAALAAELNTVTIRRPSAAKAAMIDESGPIAERRRFEAQPENRIVVPSTLTDPHPLVQRGVKLLRGAKSNKDTGILEPKTTTDMPAVRVTLATADRAMCVLDALFKALDERGMPARVEPAHKSDYGQEIGAKTVVKVGEEDVEIRLSERVLRKEAGPETRGGREHRTWQDPQYVWIRTGQLELQIDSVWAEGVRKTWSDGKKPLDDSLNDFVVALTVAGEAQRIATLEREERHRQFERQEEERRAAIRKREDEAARVRALRRLSERWSYAHEMRLLIADLKAAIAAGAATADGFAEWLAWAEAHVDRVDPLRGVLQVPGDPNPDQRRDY